MNVRAASRITALESEIKASELQIKNERKKIELLNSYHVNEERRLKEMTESSYQHDFEIQKAQIKLRHLTGVEQDKAVLEKKEKTIDDLQKCLKDKMDLQKLLQTQINTLEVR